MKPKDPLNFTDVVSDKMNESTIIGYKPDVFIGKQKIISSTSGLGSSNEFMITLRRMRRGVFDQLVICS